MIKKILAVLVLCIFCIQSPSFAATLKKIDPEKARYKPSEWPSEKLYIDRAFGKMTFGVWNFFLGLAEVIKEPYESAVLGDNVFVGFGRGVLYAVADVGGGFLNFMTFPITALKIPLPEGGVEAREF